MGSLTKKDNNISSIKLPREPIICALDTRSPERATQVYRQLNGVLSAFKIGHSLFLRPGVSDLIQEIISDGNEVFLDAKLHDTPHTLEAGLRAHFDAGAIWSTVIAHVLPSLGAGVLDAEDGIPEVVAVPVLTSVNLPTLARKILLLTAARDNPSLTFFVSAPTDPIPAVRAEYPDRKFYFFCPGIILDDVDKASPRDHNERSVATARQAAANGADAIIVGRPLLSVESPSELAKMLKEEFYRGKAA